MIEPATVGGCGKTRRINRKIGFYGFLNTSTDNTLKKRNLTNLYNALEHYRVNFKSITHKCKSSYRNVKQQKQLTEDARKGWQ